MADETSQPPPSSASSPVAVVDGTAAPDETCAVCLNALPPAASSEEDMQQQQWTCGCCRKRTHMVCIFQWCLRLVLNAQEGGLRRFSCPTCRASYRVSSLPGFQQSTSPQSQASSAGDILQRAFGLLTTTATASRTGGRARGSRRVVRGGDGGTGNDDGAEREEETFTVTVQAEVPDTQVVADDEGSDMDADPEADDEEYYGQEEEDDPIVHGASVFNLSTQRIVFDFNTLNVNIHC